MMTSANCIAMEKEQFSFFDSDALRYAVKGSNFHLQQMGKGAFQAELHSAKIGNGILDKAYYSKSLLSQGSFSNEFMIFGCVLKSKTLGCLNGKVIELHDIILSDENSPLEYLSSDDTEWTTLQFKRKDLHRLGVKTKENGQVYHMKKVQRVSDILQEILYRIEAGTVSHLDHEMIYNYILSLYANCVTDTEHLKVVESKQLARQLYHYINANADTPLQMIDLTELTGKSERTLERVFKRHFGTTPYSYLKLHRLNLIRKQILTYKENFQFQSITQIALNNGFTQMGYFSSEYKKLFGETPSETLLK